LIHNKSSSEPAFGFSQTHYGLATIRMLLEFTGLFCKRALYKRLYSAKETRVWECRFSLCCFSHRKRTLHQTRVAISIESKFFFLFRESLFSHLKRTLHQTREPVYKLCFFGKLFSLRVHFFFRESLFSQLKRFLHQTRERVYSWRCLEGLFSLRVHFFFFFGRVYFHTLNELCIRLENPSTNYLFWQAIFIESAFFFWESLFSHLERTLDQNGEAVYSWRVRWHDGSWSIYIHVYIYIYEYMYYIYISMCIV